MLAHTGLPIHGALDGLTHPIFGIDHLLAMLAVGVLAAVVRTPRAWLVPVGFVAGLLAGAALGLAGIAIPLVEAAIVASVVVCGILVAAPPRLTGRVAVAMVATAIVFGAVHGHAHGAELPSGAVPVAYAAGFVTTTILLHLSGTGIGLGLVRLRGARIAAGSLLAAAGAALALGVI